MNKADVDELAETARLNERNAMDVLFIHGLIWIFVGVWFFNNQIPDSFVDTSLYVLLSICGSSLLLTGLVFNRYTLFETAGLFILSLLSGFMVYTFARNPEYQYAMYFYVGYWMLITRHFATSIKILWRA